MLLNVKIAIWDSFSSAFFKFSFELLDRDRGVWIITKNINF